MDLTPQVINEVEFSMARRGYDPDQVDEFLEKVAVAIGDLNSALAEAREQVAAAEERAAAAERVAAERPERVVQVPAQAPAAPSPSSMAAAAEAELETLKRTLVLAQKTADAAVKEAEVEARRIIANAEADARAAHEETRRRLIDELAALESNRDSLRDDVRAIERHLDEQRLRLRGSIAELQRILEDPSRLRPASLPPAVTSPEPVAALAERSGSGPAESRALEAGDEPAPAEDVAVDPVGAERGDAGDAGAVAAPEEPEPGPGAKAGTPAAAPSERRRPRGRDDADDETWARFGPDEDDAGPPTQPVLRLDEVERASDAATEPDPPSGKDDDAYMAELRKAMLDDTGAPDLDADDLLDLPGERRRFGRRR